MAETKEYLLTRAALGDPAFLMQLDLAKVGFRISKIASENGSPKVFLRNGSIFTAHCLEALDAKIHIYEKSGGYIKLEVIGGKLMEVSSNGK